MYPTQIQDRREETQRRGRPDRLQFPLFRLGSPQVDRQLDFEQESDQSQLYSTEEHHDLRGWQRHADRSSLPPPPLPSGPTPPSKPGTGVFAIGQATSTPSSTFGLAELPPPPPLSRSPPAPPPHSPRLPLITGEPILSAPVSLLPYLPPTCSSAADPFAPPPLRRGEEAESTCESLFGLAQGERSESMDRYRSLPPPPPPTHSSYSRSPWNGKRIQEGDAPSSQASSYPTVSPSPKVLFARGRPSSPTFSFKAGKRANECGRAGGKRYERKRASRSVDLGLVLTRSERASMASIDDLALFSDIEDMRRGSLSAGDTSSFASTVRQRLRGGPRTNFDGNAIGKQQVSAGWSQWTKDMARKRKEELQQEREVWDEIEREGPEPPGKSASVSPSLPMFSFEGDQDGGHSPLRGHEEESTAKQLHQELFRKVSGRRPAKAVDESVRRLNIGEEERI